jgi:hypothetical protein
MQNRHDLERTRLWPVNNGVIRISRQRPETKRPIRERTARMAARRSFGNKRAGGVNGLLYAVSHQFAVHSNKTPDLKDVRFGKCGERVGAHGQEPGKRLDNRHSSFFA